MPAKGKHRRPRINPLTRGIAAAGTGGAVVALPLLGATGAHAAEQSAPATVPAQVVTVAAQAKTHATAGTAPTTYSVVPGDYLSKIAAEHHLTGGWQKLYADNRRIVGENPSLILPGMKLTLGAKSTAPATPKSATAKSGHPKSAAQPSAPSKSKPSKSAAETTAPQGSGDSARASRGSERPATTVTTPESGSSVQSSGSSASSSAGSSSAGSAVSSGWVTPVSGGGFSTPYRASGSMWSSGYHTGVDFIASSGTTVRAVGAGTVVSAGWSGAYGNEIVIQHADGAYSQYAHLSSLSVSAGQSVAGGRQIGLSGSTGNSTGPHLHFEIRTSPNYGSDVDPLAYLRGHGVSV
ncbi:MULTISPECIES: M23 family metallopeptidase [unclassified Streptomyces]|uniref:M23 family metallopeptidase n=1 Tax=unclassified Streptomyces TaxID=2593676 RepID=UPI0016610ADD|nr:MULTISPECIES: M23 family metallopeptidase [unclassified Streptomyces]MBD0710224.1 peptidase [Streptomyces sp. CBMA291]MBD0715752.1 peptidase [Streptomyces sp. CBMA370]